MARLSDDKDRQRQPMVTIAFDSLSVMYMLYCLGFFLEMKYCINALHKSCVGPHESSVTSGNGVNICMYPYYIHIYIYLHIHVYIYIYAYLYIYIHVYVYVYMYIYEYIHIYIYIYIHTSSYIHIYVYIHSYIYVPIHTHIYTYICLYKCTFVYIYTYTYIYIYIYIYIFVFIPNLLDARFVTVVCRGWCDLCIIYSPFIHLSIRTGESFWVHVP